MKRTMLIAVVAFIAGGFSMGLWVKKTTPVPAVTSAQLPGDWPDIYTSSFADLTNTLNSQPPSTVDHYGVYDLVGIDQNTIAILRKISAGAQHSELKQFANEAITKNEAEVAQLYAWQHAWGYSHH